MGSPELRLVISDDFHLLLKQTRSCAGSKAMQFGRDPEERGERLGREGVNQQDQKGEKSVVSS